MDLRKQLGKNILLPLASAALATPAQAQVPSQGGPGSGIPTTPASMTGCFDGSFETVPIFYANPEKVAEQLRLLRPLTNSCGDVVGTNIGSPNSVMIYGTLYGREQIKRYIGSFDLPRERVHMDLWAVQISSADKAKLSGVMDQVQRQVDQTREAMQLTYNQFSELSNAIEVDSYLQRKLDNIGFSSVFQEDPKLSLTQMLLRIAMAKDPLKNYDDAATNICNFFANNSNKIRFGLYNAYEGRTLEAYNIQRIFNDDPKRAFRRPFQGFMSLALHQKFEDSSLNPKCGDGNIGMTYDEAIALGDPKRLDPRSFSSKQEFEKKLRAALVAQGVERRRAAIIRFASSYRKYQNSPTSEYDPAELANNASMVDGMLSPIVDAINRDVEDYFIQPTLLKVRQIVGRNRGVEYAEVGRTTIAGINGNDVNVTSGTITSFDEPTPLRLSKWLDDAASEKQKVDNIFPNLQGVPLGGAASKSFVEALPAPQAVLATLPATSALQLLSALSKEEVSWQALTSGITLNLKPIVLRNQAQATVDVNLTIADPASESKDKTQDSATPSTNPQLRPLSRISKSIVRSKVYINTWDLFALSSFNNQTTITGRRWYVPLVGTIWEGAFGDIPVLGGWFSFKRPPQNIQHQSIILTNTLIVPSAMGMASYFTKMGSSPYPYSIQTTPPGRF